MPHTFRTIILVLVLAGSGGSAFGPGAPADSAASGIVAAQPAETVVEPLTERQQQLVQWAKGRFALAGLELPDMAIRFDPTRALCGRADGLYHHSPSNGVVVTICTRDSDSFAAELEIRRTLLHEFGHAWDFANLTDDDRAGLGSQLGASEWLDDDAAWEERGAERFAETFVLALLDQPRRTLKIGLECTVAIEVFRTATGAEPLGPGLPSCVS